MDIQTAIMLDELPGDVLRRVEQSYLDIAKLREILSGVDLSGYFSKIKDKQEQTNFAASCINQFLVNRN